MDKKTLRKELEGNVPLEQILDLTIGQCGCTIYKLRAANGPIRHNDFDNICYIPDMELNDIPYDKPFLSDEEIDDILEYCYTFQDFIDLCHGDINKAKAVYNNCDWQHPSTEYDEMELFDEEDMEGEDEERPWHAVTRWCADDVIGIAKSAGIEMTDEQAEDWWREHERGFRQMMVQAGNEILETMIK